MQRQDAETGVQIQGYKNRVPVETGVQRQGCRVGWVNLYKKFEIEKYTACCKLILPKKIERHF